MEIVRIHSAIIAIVLTSGSLAAPMAAMAVDSGYVDAVEADLAEFTTGSFQAPADSTWVGVEATEADGAAPALADLEGFSSFLRSKSPGSFIFYNKLSDEYKELLHKDYLATGDLERVKADIFKYTRESKK